VGQADMGSLRLVGCVIRPPGGGGGKIGRRNFGVRQMLGVTQKGTLPGCHVVFGEEGKVLWRVSGT
jgi:hypothetical protein